MRASKILAIAIIFAVVVFLAAYSVIIASFDVKPQEGGEAEAEASPQSICYVGAGLSRPEEYRLAMLTRERLRNLEGYGFYIYDSASEAEQAELLSGFAADPPAMVVLRPYGEKTGESVSALVSAGTLVISTGECGAKCLSVEYSPAEIEAALKKAPGAGVTDDSAAAAEGETVIYLDNTALADAIAGVITAAASGEIVSDVTLSPQIVTGEDMG